MRYEFDLPLNPEPWAIGQVGTGRRGGKMYAYVARNQQLYVFQQAVKELVGKHEFLVRPIHLQFHFWRDIQEYKTEESRSAHAHEADGTNMTKALEDALQGCIYENDRDVKSSFWKIVEQAPGVESRVHIIAYDERD